MKVEKLLAASGAACAADALAARQYAWLSPAKIDYRSHSVQIARESCVILLSFLNRRASLASRIDLNSGEITQSDGVLGMITPAERRALSAFGEHIWRHGARRDGLIIDAGPFVGASTLALAEGLRRSGLTERERRERIWSYDLFRTTRGMSASFFGPDGPKAGESFRALYERNLAPFSDEVRVLEGDIAAADPPDRPVAILFVDILWNWASTLSFSRTFYPKLDPGRSVVLHQDFSYPYYPWLVISMGLLRDQLPLARTVPYSTAVFDVRRRLRARDIDDPRNVGVRHALEIYDYFIGLMDGYPRGALALGKALYLASHRRTSEARRLVAEVEDRHRDEPLVLQYVKSILNYARLADDGAARPLDEVSGF